MSDKSCPVKPNHAKRDFFLFFFFRGDTSEIFSMRSFYLCELESENLSRSEMMPPGEHKSRATERRRLFFVPNQASDFHKSPKTQRNLTILSNDCDSRCPPLSCKKICSQQCNQPPSKLTRFAFSASVSTLSRRVARSQGGKCICQTERRLERLLRKKRSI